MEAGSGIRKSAYEPGLWFVPAEPGTTLQDHGTQWQVRRCVWHPGAQLHRPRAPPSPPPLHPPLCPQIGTRYSLVRVLGYGSFSSVCLAVDEATGEQVGALYPPAQRVQRRSPSAAPLLRCFPPPAHAVQARPRAPAPPRLQVALKRVADVLQSPEHTRRVLREVCILRRLRHPNLISIRDAFVRPSATGQCRLRGGKLVNLSVDVYIALELAAGGDLFHLRGHLTGGRPRAAEWLPLPLACWHVQAGLPPAACVYSGRSRRFVALASRPACTASATPRSRSCRPSPLLLFRVPFPCPGCQAARCAR